MKNLKARETFVVDLNILFVDPQGKILLTQRQNTGYFDGFWSLVAGHPERDENILQAAAREAAEEVGIYSDPSQYDLVHVMQRRTTPPRVSLFFKVTKWEGSFINNEPEKCSAIQWFHPEEIPEESTVNYIKAGLFAILRGQKFSDFTNPKE